MAMPDPLFEITMEVNLRNCGPVEHLRNFMRKQLTQEDIEQDGNHLGQLVTYKAKEIANEYNNKLDDASDIDAMAGLADPTGEDTARSFFVRKMAASHRYAQAAGFYRRIVRPCEGLHLVLGRIAAIGALFLIALSDAELRAWSWTHQRRSWTTPCSKSGNCSKSICSKPEAMEHPQCGCSSYARTSVGAWHAVSPPMKASTAS